MNPHYASMPSPSHSYNMLLLCSYACSFPLYIVSWWVPCRLLIEWLPEWLDSQYLDAQTHSYYNYILKLFHLKRNFVFFSLTYVYENELSFNQPTDQITEWWVNMKNLIISYMWSCLGLCQNEKYNWNHQLGVSTIWMTNTISFPFPVSMPYTNPLIIHFCFSSLLNIQYQILCTYSNSYSHFSFISYDSIRFIVLWQFEEWKKRRSRSNNKNKMNLRK